MMPHRVEHAVQHLPKPTHATVRKWLPWPIIMLGLCKLTACPETRYGVMFAHVRLISVAHDDPAHASLTEETIHGACTCRQCVGP